MTYLDKLFLIKHTDRNPYIEGLRALAIIMVFNVHYFGQYHKEYYFFPENSTGEWIGKTLQAGMIGVDLFFVISGYLLYRVLTRKNYNLKDFLVNRMRRLLPVNIVVITLVAIGSFNLNKYLLNIFFLQSFLTTDSSYNYVNWSLTWEWCFYLVIFISMSLSKGRDSILLLCLAVSSIVLIFNEIYLRDFLSSSDLILPTPFRFINFYIGVLVAMAEKRPALKINMNAIYIITLLCIPSLCIVWVDGSYVNQWVYYPVVGIVFGALLYITNNYHTSIRQVFKLYPLRLLGQISYSFYLIHAVFGLPLGSAIFNKFMPINNTVAMIMNYVFCFGLTVVLSSISFILLERPFMIKKTNPAPTYTRQGGHNKE